MGKGLAVFALGAMLFASACAPVDRSRGTVPSGSAEDLRLADVPAADVAPVAARPAPTGLRVESRSFYSDALGRTMPYKVYLPPQYATDTTRRFPTLYLLHGMGGSDDQWIDVGAPVSAEKMIRSGQIAPLVVVMPEGETAYWVDHANGGPRWGAYVAVDLVKEVESAFRVQTGQTHRAIGGLSMGAHGAVQLALNYPGVFGVVGAHSLVLRRFDSAPAYFGDQQQWSQRDPMGLVKTKPQAVRAVALWIDIGKDDPWAPLAERFDRELTDLHIAHQWHEWPGDHSGIYWSAHLGDYLRFYDAALAGVPAFGGRLVLPPLY
ncbi:MAG: hypothetical protein AUG02_01075 [Chloroflexi bacterium 13_1_20CM_2_70_9]|nr:MAG: hypothetical protein AUG02_01075 [Chloroflexi bacterium 13_1_20CM_2_70_9]